MTSAKQLANQKRFAMRSKRGDFRKAKKSKLHLTKGDTVSHQMIKGKMWTSVTSKGVKSSMKQAEKLAVSRSLKLGKLIYGKTPAYHRKKLRELGYTERTINKFLRSHGKD